MKKGTKKQTIGALLKLVQKDFNKYIRLRDEGLPCISCGIIKELQAGHYFAVGGYSGLRFDKMNVHGECAGCNLFNESHLIGYGDNIVKRIGQDEVDALKERAAQYKRGGHKWSRSDLLEFRQEIKELIASLSR